MHIGLIDVDGHNFPNLPLMKLSAWHKSQGDTVDFYSPFGGHYDRVYCSKIFSFTPDYEYAINADEVICGGTGYSISLVDGREVFDSAGHKNLPDEIEHIYPDYSLYPELTKDTAYGFMTRGCPNNCGFCIVSKKEGRCSVKVADLSEFWRGQKEIKLLDPNILACREHLDLLLRLADSGAYVDFTQGIDIRLTNERNIELINRIKLKQIHFAWDNPNQDLLPHFKRYAEMAEHKPHGHYGTVYCLTNFGSTMQQNLERIYALRDAGYLPYVMIYDKAHADKDLRRLQRWVNSPWIFNNCKDFKDYNLVSSYPKT